MPSPLRGKHLKRLSSKEKQIFSLAKLYEQIRRERIGNIFYHLRKFDLSVDPRESPEWIHFARLLQVLQFHNLKAKDYIISQFEGFKNWRQNPIPLPHQMYSQNAMNRYDTWLEKQRARPKVRAVTDVQEIRYKIEQSKKAIAKFQKLYSYKNPSEVLGNIHLLSFIDAEYLKRSKAFKTLLGRHHFKNFWGVKNIKQFLKDMGKEI